MFQVYDDEDLNEVLAGIRRKLERHASNKMRKILVFVVILFSNLAIAEGLHLPSAVFDHMGYRIVSSRVFDPTSWEKRNFNVLEKSVTKIKSIEQVPGEPNWYYRFNVIVEKYPDQQAAAKRVRRVLKKPPGLSPSAEKSFPLRKAFQKGTYVYTVATDVSLYYHTELDPVLNELRQGIE